MWKQLCTQTIEMHKKKKKKAKEVKKLNQIKVSIFVVFFFLSKMLLFSKFKNPKKLFKYPLLIQCSKFPLEIIYKILKTEVQD